MLKFLSSIGSRASSSLMFLPLAAFVFKYKTIALSFRLLSSYSLARCGFSLGQVLHGVGLPNRGCGFPLWSWMSPLEL